MCFEFGERHFYWVQIRAGRRKNEEPATVFAKERIGLLVAMGGQIVEDHSSAGFDLGDEHVAEVGDNRGAGYSRQCVWQSQVSREALPL